MKRSMPIVKTLHLTCRYSRPEGQPIGVTVEVKKSGLFSPCSDVLTTILKSVICLKPI